jgi:hypothetical protein
MTDMKEKAIEVLYSYMDVEKDLPQPKILIHTFKVLIHQLQYDNCDWDAPDGHMRHMIIDVKDILKLIDELEAL